uniref:Uncharacterized protein n=1 Tax=Anguilla anguilla TaxID=7936 RepID=A0A0E9TZC6_ANGAN
MWKGIIHRSRNGQKKRARLKLCMEHSLSILQQSIKL